MKIFHPYLIIILLFILSIPYNVVDANKDIINEVKIIEVYNEDITGDGFNEVIKLKGERLTKESKYFQHIWAEITSKEGDNWVIPYGQGYQPSLSFIDLNHNSQKEILFHATLKENTETSLKHIHSLLKNTFIELKIPTHKYVHGSFQDNFRAEIFLLPNHPPEIIDLETSKEQYTDLGIYNNKGQLQKDTSIKQSNVTKAIPISPSDRQGNGMETTEQIYGINDNDLLGIVKTRWYYENDQWINLQTTFIEQ